MSVRAPELTACRSLRRQDALHVASSRARPRERAALDWTDHLTLIAEKRAPDAVYAALDAQFSKEEQVKLTMMIVNINGWNRLAVGFNLFDANLGWKG